MHDNCTTYTAAQRCNMNLAECLHMSDRYDLVELNMWHVK